MAIFNYTIYGKNNMLFSPISFSIIIPLCVVITLFKNITYLNDTSS